MKAHHQRNLMIKAVEKVTSMSVWKLIIAFIKMPLFLLQTEEEKHLQEELNLLVEKILVRKLSFS